MGHQVIVEVVVKVADERGGNAHDALGIEIRELPKELHGLRATDEVISNE